MTPVSIYIRAQLSFAQFCDLPQIYFSFPNIDMPATDQSAFPVPTTSYEEVRHPEGEVEGVPKLFKGQALDQGRGEAKKQSQS